MKSFKPDATFLILYGFALFDGIIDVKVELDVAVYHVSNLAKIYPDIHVFVSNIDIRPV